MAGPTPALRPRWGRRWALSDHGGPNLKREGGVGPRVGACFTVAGLEFEPSDAGQLGIRECASTMCPRVCGHSARAAMRGVTRREWTVLTVAAASARGPFVRGLALAAHRDTAQGSLHYSLRSQSLSRGWTKCHRRCHVEPEVHGHDWRWSRWLERRWQALRFGGSHARR